MIVRICKSDGHLPDIPHSADLLEELPQTTWLEKDDGMTLTDVVRKPELACIYDTC